MAPRVRYSSLVQFSRVSQISHVAVLLVLLLAYVASPSAAQARAQNATATVLHWSDPHDVALAERYCNMPDAAFSNADTSREDTDDHCDLVRPAPEQTYRWIVAPMSGGSGGSGSYPPASVCTGDAPASGEPTAVYLCGTPPDGMSRDAYLFALSARCNATVFLVCEDKTVPGFLSYEYDPVAWERERRARDLYVLALSPTGQAAVPAHLLGGEGAGGDQASLQHVQLNLTGTPLTNDWEAAIGGLPIEILNWVWIFCHVGALVHSGFRLMHIDDLSPRNLWKDTHAFSLVCIIFGNLFRTLFVIIDPMSRYLVIASSASSFIGVFGVPWSLMTFALVSTHWMGLLHKRLDVTKKRISLYKTIGVSVSGVVIVLAVVSSTGTLLYVYSMSMLSFLYFLIYAFTQLLFSIFFAVQAVRVHRNLTTTIERMASTSKQQRLIRMRHRIKHRTIFVVVSAVLVLISFGIFALPPVTASPGPYLGASTFIAFALMLLSIAQVELFSYRDGHKNHRSRTAGTTSGTSTSSDPSSAKTTGTMAISSVSADPMHPRSVLSGIHETYEMYETDEGNPVTESIAGGHGSGSMTRSTPPPGSMHSRSSRAGSVRKGKGVTARGAAITVDGTLLLLGGDDDGTSSTSRTTTPSTISDSVTLSGASSGGRRVSMSVPYRGSFTIISSNVVTSRSTSSGSSSSSGSSGSSGSSTSSTLRDSNSTSSSADSSSSSSSVLSNRSDSSKSSKSSKSSVLSGLSSTASGTDDSDFSAPTLTTGTESHTWSTVASTSTPSDATRPVHGTRVSGGGSARVPPLSPMDMARAGPESFSSSPHSNSLSSNSTPSNSRSSDEATEDSSSISPSSSGTR